MLDNSSDDDDPRSRMAKLADEYFPFSKRAKSSRKFEQSSTDLHETGINSAESTPRSSGRFRKLAKSLRRAPAITMGALSPSLIGRTGATICGVGLIFMVCGAIVTKIRFGSEAVGFGIHTGGLIVNLIGLLIILVGLRMKRAEQAR